MWLCYCGWLAKQHFKCCWQSSILNSHTRTVQLHLLETLLLLACWGKKYASDGKERKNCWDAARWKPSSSEQFGNTPKMECRVKLWVCLPARESCRVEMAGTTLHAGNQLSPLLHAQLRAVPCWRAAFWVYTEHSAASCDETGGILVFAFSVT